MANDQTADTRSVEQQKIQDHLDAESAFDIDQMVATVSEDVAYEFPLQGKRFRGRENARRFYSRNHDRATPMPDASQIRMPQITHRWVSDTALIIEAIDYPVVLDDGTLSTAGIGTVIEARADGVTHERMYTTDDGFRTLTRHVEDVLEAM